MGYTLIKTLDGAEKNRKLYYLDSPDDLPIIDPQHVIAAGSEARVLTTGDKWIVNSELVWVPIPKETSSGGGGIGEAPFDGEQYARESGTWSKVNATNTPVEDSLTSTDPTIALSAAQGKVLNDKLNLTSGYVGNLQTEDINIKTDITNIQGDISNLQTAVSDLNTDISQVSSDLSNFETDVANDYVSKSGFISELAVGLQDSSIPAYGTDISYNAATRTVTMDKNDTTTETFILPQSTNTQDGLMTAADRVAFTEVLSDVESLKNGGVWREEFDTYASLIAAHPSLDVSTTEWFVNDYVEVIADESPTAGIHIQGNPTIYRVEVDPTGLIKTLAYQKDVASSSVQTATNTAVGVVKGDNSNTAGKVFVETDGSMSLIGYDTHTQNISDNTQDIAALQVAETALTGRVTTVETNITGLRQRMTAAENAATVLAGWANQADLDIIDHTDVLSDHTTELANHETRISANEAWIAAPHIASTTDSGTVKLSAGDWELGGDPDGHLVVNGAQAYITDIDQRLLGSTGKVGEIFWWPGVTPPDDALYCDGSAVSRQTYSQLFAIIGDNFGAGDGSTTFNLPDMRGEFVRGYDPTAIRDPQGATRGIGQHQNATAELNFDTHAIHSMPDATTLGGYLNPDGVTGTTNGFRIIPNYQTDNTVRNLYHLVRPTNINLLPCIRFRATLIDQIGFPRIDYTNPVVLPLSGQTASPRRYIIPENGYTSIYGQKSGINWADVRVIRNNSESYPLATVHDNTLNGTYALGIFPVMKNDIILVHFDGFSSLSCIFYAELNDIKDHMYNTFPLYSNIAGGITLPIGTYGTNLLTMPYDGYIHWGRKVGGNGSGTISLNIDGLNVGCNNVNSTEEGFWLTPCMAGSKFRIYNDSNSVEQITFTTIPLGGSATHPNINSPHLWPENIEIDLGDGSFGYRAVGTFNATAVPYTVAIPMFSTLISCGGEWNWFTGNAMGAFNTCDFNSGVSSAVYQNNFRFAPKTTYANALYNVWVRYTK